MDNRSRGKRDLPKGLPLDGEGDLPQKNLIRTLNLDLSRSQSRNWQGAQPSVGQNKRFLISKAYAEPLGHDDMIENLLLQRDYIID